MTQLAAAPHPTAVDLASLREELLNGRFGSEVQRVQGSKCDGCSIMRLPLQVLLVRNCSLIGRPFLGSNGEYFPHPCCLIVVSRDHAQRVAPGELPLLWAEENLEIVRQLQGEGLVLEAVAEPYGKRSGLLNNHHWQRELIFPTDQLTSSVIRSIQSMPT